MVTVSPATSSVPVRGSPEFRATSTTVEPLPVPLVPDLIISHDPPLVTDAVHAQELAVSMVIVRARGPLWSLWSTLNTVGDTTYVQGATPAA